MDNLSRLSFSTTAIHQVINRIRMIILTCCVTNLYKYGFPMSMPLFCDKQTFVDNTKQLLWRASCNVLRKTMQSQSYVKLLRNTALPHGICLRTGSKMTFARQKYIDRYVVDLTLSEMEGILKFDCLASYTDLAGHIHKIYLPSLLLNSQYFWLLFYTDTQLSLNGVLNFNPREIVTKSHCHRCSIPRKPESWSYVEYEQFCDLYLLPDALDAVLLYINYGQINYTGSLRAYVAACYYLQSDAALVYLFECGQIVFENFLSLATSVLNLFGPAHPVFEFLVLYGSSNIFGISYFGLLNILAMPNDVCNFLCVNQTIRRIKIKNCKFSLETMDSTDSWYTPSMVLISLGNMCKRNRFSNRYLSSSDQFYCDGLNIFLENHVRYNIIYKNLREYQCIICRSILFHCSKVSHDGGKSWSDKPGYIPEILSAELLCCFATVHRTCFHEVFCSTNDWFCPRCGKRYVNHCRVSRYREVNGKDTFVMLQLPYRINDYYVDSTELSFSVNVCSRPKIETALLTTQANSL